MKASLKLNSTNETTFIICVRKDKQLVWYSSVCAVCPKVTNMCFRKDKCFNGFYTHTIKYALEFELIDCEKLLVVLGSLKWIIDRFQRMQTISI